MGLTLLVLLNPAAKARAASAWEVLFNGVPSQMAVVEGEGGPLIPVYFPVSEAGQTDTYTVQVKRDSDEQRISVLRVKKKRPVRDLGDCPKCEGSEDCQQCYPAGSKENTAGLPCMDCNATGECAFCQGSGDCYTCDAHGLEGGCSTCGKVAVEPSTTASY